MQHLNHYGRCQRSNQQNPRTNETNQKSFNLKENKHLRITRGLTGDCSCDANCIGEIMGNVKLQIHGHSNPCNDLEAVRYSDEN